MKIRMKISSDALVALVVLSAALSSIFMSGCLSPGCVMGSGNVVNETRDVGTFDGIDVTGSADIYITQGSYHPIRIEAEDNIIDALDTRVVGGTLMIGSRRCLMPREPIRVYASSDEVRRLSVSGAASIISTNGINASDLEIDISGDGLVRADVGANRLRTEISGSGEADLSGEADRHEIDISGDGDVRSSGLSTNRTEIDISGSGLAEVNVAGALIVDASGDAEVVYEGGPDTVEQRISGSGSVTGRRGG